MGVRKLRNINSLKPNERIIEKQISHFKLNLIPNATVGISLLIPAIYSQLRTKREKNERDAGKVRKKERRDCLEQGNKISERTNAFLKWNVIGYQLVAMPSVVEDLGYPWWST